MAVTSLLLVAFFAFNGIFFDCCGFVPAVSEPSYGAPVDRPAFLYIAVVLLLFSILHVLSPRWSGARADARVALTFVVFIFVV